jgi:predicted aspartyl protease
MPDIPLAEEVKDLNIDTRGARVSFLSPQRSSGVLELKFDAALHLRVTARINGVDASAIVDSGAGRTVIDSTFASKNGMLLRTGFNVAGITGNTYGHFADGTNITLGNLVIED